MFDYLASSIAFAHSSLEEACDRVAAVGVKKLDLWLVPGMCEQLPPIETALDVARIRRALAKSGLALHAMSVYGVSQEITLARLEQLKELGGSVLIRDALADGISDPNVVVERCRPLLKRAEELGVMLAPENHGNTAFDSIAQMEHVLKALPSPNLGVAYAPIHSYRRKEDPAAAIRAVAKRIAFFYAWDWGISADANWKDPDQQLPGTGVLDFKSMFRALQDVGHAQPLCPFAHGIEDWPAARAEAELKRALGFCRKVEQDLAER